MKVYEWFKIFRPEINLSSVLNEFLKLKMKETDSNISIEKAEEILKEINNKFDDLEKDRSLAFIKLEQAREKASKERKEEEIANKEEEERIQFQYKTLRNNHHLWSGE